MISNADIDRTLDDIEVESLIRLIVRDILALRSEKQAAQQTGQAT